jgi:hypothetical protein
MPRTLDDRGAQSYRPDDPDGDRSRSKDEDLVALAEANNADLLVSIDNDLLEAPIDDLTICRQEILSDRLAGV